MNVALEIQKARIELITDQPFFGSLCMRLALVADEFIETFATNGRRISYNPKFAATLTRAQIKGTLAHEVMHCALAHHCRREGRDVQRWNRACDYAVNPLLFDAGLELPDGALNEVSFHGMSAEDIYRLLPETPSNQSGNGCGEVQDGTDDQGAPADAQELEQQAQEWQIAAQAQEAACKRQGQMPGGVDRALDANKAAKVDWRSALRRFMIQTMPMETSWARSNRRFIGSGLYLPGNTRENMGPLVVAVDTSGSINEPLLGEFGAEITALAAETRPASIDVVYCDAAVNASERYQPGEEIRLTPKGGGGTDFSPVFHWTDEQEQQPAALVYLTDMMGRFPTAAPDYPVLWVSYSTIDTAPFGEVVRA